jgi:hypothetical protein
MQSLNLSPFDKTFWNFQELVTHTSGDFDELSIGYDRCRSNRRNTIDDFIEDLKEKRIHEELKRQWNFRNQITAKTRGYSWSSFE